MNDAKIKCPSTFCIRDAVVTKGKRRLTVKCPNCGPLNFQTNTGQAALKKYMVERGVSIGGENTDKSTDKPTPPISETTTNDSALSGNQNRQSASETNTDKTPVKRRGLFSFLNKVDA